MKNFLALFIGSLFFTGWSFALTREEANQVVREICIKAKQCQKGTSWELIAGTTVGSIGVFRDAFPTETFQQQLFELPQLALVRRGIFVHPASFDGIWVRSTLSELAEVIYNEQEPAAPR